MENQTITITQKGGTKTKDYELEVPTTDVELEAVTGVENSFEYVRGLWLAKVEKKLSIIMWPYESFGNKKKAVTKPEDLAKAVKRIRPLVKKPKSPLDRLIKKMKKDGAPAEKIQEFADQYREIMDTVEAAPASD